VFRATLRAAGLPRFRLYDLRHTFATHLLLQGAIGWKRSAWGPRRGFGAHVVAMW